jgi:alpha-L-arabinofuranosidase
VLVLKVVNFAPFSLRTKIHIAGVGQLRPIAQTVLLTGDNLNVDNTADQPTSVVPVTRQRAGIGPDFVHDFPAYSYAILDFRAESR